MMWQNLLSVSRWLHLLFNLGVQVVVGLPLEMVHGSLRIAAVYMAGVLAGKFGFGALYIYTRPRYTLFRDSAAVCLWSRVADGDSAGLPDVISLVFAK